ncbi:MAG: hypothetical protein LBI19_11050 [Oscillospiraceae bacterium]|jgi:hypothetical protein|nr:hypothetical protein [Oscillospiraceae bacterium]
MDTLDNKIGGTFDNLAQRLIYPYVLTFPEFEHVEREDVSETAQRHMHVFLRSALSAIYANPHMIGLPIEEDDCFIDEPKKAKPVLYNTMRKLEKSFLSFFTVLFELGLHGEVIDGKLCIPKAKKDVNKPKQAILSHIGLVCETEKDKSILFSPELPELCHGWKALSEHAGANGNGDAMGKCPAGLYFLKCLYMNGPIPISRLYGKLKQSGGHLEELEAFLLEQGYVYQEYDGSYCLLKACKGNKDGKFKILFDSHKRSQLTYYYEIPGFTRLVTNHFDEMDDSLKNFVFAHTSKCGHCGYCTKTGTHRLMSVMLTLPSQTEEKCPLYAGFEWDSLYEENVVMVKRLIEFAIKML